MTGATNELDVLRRWIGRSERVDDVLDPRQARLMETTLDREASLAAGDALPPLWHWIYFRTAAPLSRLERDGHAGRGGLLPPVALPRRMWAGSRVRWHEPLFLGETAGKTSTVTEVALKEGRTGLLCFVTVTHEIAVGGDVRMTEEQDLVFREDPRPDDGAPSPLAPPDQPRMSRTITPTPVLLFRYSALTFNGHRIHYDRTYVTEVEGYPGLVVHGPLIATLLADLARSEMGTGMQRFGFRAVAPLFDTESFEIKARSTDAGVDVWAETPDSGLAMRAEATW